MTRFFLLLICSLFITASAHAQSGPIPPIDTGYGADGPYGMVVKKYTNPTWGGKPCFLFAPDTATLPRPTILFGHGFGGNDTTFYKDLIEHIVSRGYTFIFSPYPTSGGYTILQRYDIMFTGYEEALQRYPSYIDSTQIGMMGHSFGAGAVPSMMHRALNNKNWGQNSAFMMMLAPWYVYDITQSELQSYPGHVKLLMQVYTEDGVNDHRMARDIFQMTNIDWSEKDYTRLFSDSNSSYKLQADHYTPIEPGGYGLGEVDGLDYYGIYRHFDALADYTFYGSDSGKTVALGNGNPSQTYMGKWPNDTLVKRLSAGDNPTIPHAQSYYDYKCDTFLNPRRQYCDTVVTPGVFSRGSASDHISVQQYPNPASRTVTYQFTLPQRSKVTFVWKNAKGQELRRMNLGTRGPGQYQFQFDITSYTAGLYFYQFRLNDTFRSGKCMVVR